MPLTDIDSYVTTASDFITHWSDVNADRVANALPELTVPGGYDLAGLTADRDTLQTAIAGIDGHDNAVPIAAANRDTAKEAIADRLRQFRAASDLYLKGTSYAGVVPTMPSLSISESKFLRPFDDVADVWARVNADATIPNFTAPLLLRSGYDLAAFVAELAALRGTYKVVRDVDTDRDIARRERDALLDPLKERMVQYRLALELEYEAGHPFRDTVPELTPSPGSTPDAVTAQGVWDEGTQEAVITWTPSTNPNLASYLIRFTLGGTYDSSSARARRGSLTPSLDRPRSGLHRFHPSASIPTRRVRVLDRVLLSERP